ncbi:MAG: endonuclease domain-containing protein [Nocardiaceae bacterium]|nr:endonuclease domain-containing protein [Nocardiaceae bacterium]
MHDIERIAAANGGVVSAKQLRHCGINYKTVRKLCEGNLAAIRKGWYQTRNADSAVVSVVKGGGVVSCTSALRRFGVWVPGTAQDAHVRYPAHQRRVGRHCQPYRSNPPIDAAIDTADVALEAAANCLDAEDLVVVLDSMLNKQMIEMADARTIVADSPHPSTLADRCDRRAQSGLETIVRLRLRALGIQLEIQVHIPGVGYVDILVGRRLVIETDGAEFHPDREHDYRRDLTLHELGYLPVRLSYSQVMDDWPKTRDAILTLIRRRDHLR